MEELMIKLLSDVAFPIAVSLYVLFGLNKNLSRLVEAVERLERRVERLEERIFKEATS